MTITAELMSAIGPAYRIPSKPKNNGRIKISGTSSSSWRSEDKIAALSGWPVAWK